MMNSWLFYCLLAPLCVRLSEAGDLRYHGSGETDSALFGGFSRQARQANTPPPPQQISNTTTQDTHDYYASTFYPSGSDAAEGLWFDLTSIPNIEIIPESGISESFRVFNAHPLPFDFQFYGHTINLVAVTTGGFLYTSDYLHSRIHLTQYIAPLQADFNPGLTNNSRVLIHSSTERFTVQWDRVLVTNHRDAGEFTFQVSLFRNGTIHFVYRNIPLPVSGISDDEHPVEVGVADSFYIDRPVPPNLILRRVFEYSRIRLSMDVLNHSAYVLDPLPGCVPADTCESCVTASRVSAFQCAWCTRLRRCSDGVDRFRQDWILSGCAGNRTLSCATPPPPTVTSAPATKLSTGSLAGIAVGLLIVFFLAVSIVVVIISILVYGYKHPTSSVGLFMIEHRPKARSLNKTRASYEVDSGKMNLSED